MTLTEPAGEGAPIVWRIHLDDISFEIVDYSLPMDAYTDGFRASRFRDYRVDPIELSSHTPTAWMIVRTGPICSITRRRF